MRRSRGDLQRTAKEVVRAILIANDQSRERMVNLVVLMLNEHPGRPQGVTIGQFFVFGQGTEDDEVAEYLPKNPSTNFRLGVMSLFSPYAGTRATKRMKEMPLIEFFQILKEVERMSDAERQREVLFG
jgi:hypothetical protein